MEESVETLVIDTQTISMDVSSCWRHLEQLEQIGKEEGDKLKGLSRTVADSETKLAELGKMGVLELTGKVAKLEEELEGKLAALDDLRAKVSMLEGLVRTLGARLEQDQSRNQDWATAIRTQMDSMITMMHGFQALLTTSLQNQGRAAAS